MVDHLGTNAPPGAQIGDRMSGYLTFRVQKLDPGVMGLWTYVSNCWAPPFSQQPQCHSAAGTQYEFLQGSYSPPGFSFNMWGSDGMSIELEDGKLKSMNGYYDAQTRFFWQYPFTENRWEYWDYSSNDIDPFSGPVLGAVLYASPEPASIAMMAGALLVLMGLLFARARLVLKP